MRRRVLERLGSATVSVPEENQINQGDQIHAKSGKLGTLTMHGMLRGRRGTSMSTTVPILDSTYLADAVESLFVKD